MFGHAGVLVAVCLAALFLGYRYYGGFLARHIFESEGDESETPAYELEDGVDYVPTDKHVVLGHHFTSVAGAAPIVGPAVACVYGWVPAVLWIMFGVIFMGAVQDFGSLVVSLKNRGKSIGDVAGDLIGGRARTLFLCLIVVLTWLVLAAFASIIGTLFDTFPASVFPVNIEIPMAIAIGWWVHKKGGGILIPSLVAVVVMWAAVWLSTNWEPLQWKFAADGALKPGQIWVGLLLCYSFITCILPVWVLLQPRDFINSHQLFLGLGVIYLALFLVNPEITAPTINHEVPGGVGDLFPFLFVTIACGAISGFHSLVSSGTTSKQLKSVKDARAVGYGSMLGEGALALAATMAVAAGFSAAEWHDHYGDATTVKGKGLIAFVKGTSNLLTQGFSFIDGEMAGAIVAVIVISFAATTLDTACRIQRYCLAELGSAWKLPPLRNIYVGAAIAAFTPLALVIEPSEGPPLWRQVWPVFGSSNQVLGALALLVITLWLKKKGKPIWFTGIPSLFLSVITMTGLSRMVLVQLERDTPVWAVLAPAAVLLVLAAAILFEGALALLRPASRSDGDTRN